MLLWSGRAANIYGFLLVCVLFWNLPKVVENGSTTSFPNNEWPYCCWNLTRKVCKEKSLLMFWHTYQFEIKPKYSVCKPLYSTSKKVHYVEYTCHFEIINTLMEASQKTLTLLSFSMNQRSMHCAGGTAWSDTTSYVRHHAKLRRAVPIPQGAPSFMTDIVVQLYSPALLLWEQVLTVLPGLFWLGFVRQMQPWGLLTC